MSDVVWKFPIPWHDVFTLDLPIGARPLHVSTQEGAPFVWVQLATGETFLERRTFQLVGTGAPVPEGGAYVGTFHSPDESLVFHVYEIQ